MTFFIKSKSQKTSSNNYKTQPPGSKSLIDCDLIFCDFFLALFCILFGSWNLKFVISFWILGFELWNFDFVTLHV